ncbi:Blp family class II bacteriocin, partial [Streptococcus thermophilus]|nr:ComC/BlpC family leader-containing pheromone/bacteriocin [Streptococcus thermophilus]
MATQTIENFNTLNLETLASVEGGGCGWRGAGGATVQGAIGGAFGGNVVL